MKLTARCSVRSEGAFPLRSFITTASCLLAIMTIITTQSAHAQNGSTTRSTVRQADSLSNQQPDEIETEPISDSQLIPVPFKQTGWFTRVGFLVAPYHSSTTIATNGQALSGGTAEASNNMSVTFELGYDITKNISVSVMSGIPVKPHVTGEGAAAPLGILGKGVDELDAERHGGNE